MVLQLKQKNNYFEQINPKDIWAFQKVSSQKQRRYYVKQSLIHPAKMPIFLVQKIIKEYSKPGDLILDCMAGIGTTLIEAILLGRNAIGIEYEQKFVSIIERNIKLVEAFRQKIPSMGKAIIIKGDSRNLSTILGENAIESINPAFSPPYSDISLKVGVDLKGRIFGRLFGDKRQFTKADYKHTLIQEQIDEEKGLTYSKDQTNIGNLPHGTINAIITSPPFASSLAAPASDDTSKFKHGSAGKDYSENKENKEQLANLDYGKIDAIISSPPKGGLEPFEDKNFELHGKKLNEDYTYSKNKHDKGQLANLNYGIDAIISSPPFEDNTSGLSHAGSGAEVLAGKKEPDIYTENKDDLTNLPNLSGETYLEAMLKVYKECFVCLKQGGIMALVTKNFVRKGEMVRLDLDTIKLCEAAGFTFFERKYRKLESVSFWIRNAKKKFYKKNPGKVSGDPYADYEDVLVFVKKNKGVS